MTDKVFYLSLVEHLRIWLMNFLPQMGAALILSAPLYLQQKIGGMKFFRAAFYLPNLITAASVGLLFNLLFNGDKSVANYILTGLGCPGPFQLLPTAALHLAWCPTSSGGCGLGIPRSSSWRASPPSTPASTTLHWWTEPPNRRPIPKSPCPTHQAYPHLCDHYLHHRRDAAFRRAGHPSPTSRATPRNPSSPRLHVPLQPGLQELQLRLRLGHFGGAVPPHRRPQCAGTEGHAEEGGMYDD